jgi:hypothetical protein
MTTVAGPRQAGWREHWARQKNQRREQAHQAALAAWQQQDVLHQRWIEVATTFQPSHDREAVPGLRSKREEAIYWFGDGVALVETPHAAGLRPPDSGELLDSSLRQGAPVSAGPPVDVGQAVVTSQRVVFLGRGRREWAYAKLTGFVHTPGAILMLVSNRKKVSGVALQPAIVADMRLRLALALADASGGREGLVGQLRQQADRHRRARPQPPPHATPDEAPISAWFSGVRLLAVVAASVFILLLCTIGTALAGNGQGPAALPDQAETHATGPSPIETAGPSRATPSPSDLPNVDRSPEAGAAVDSEPAGTGADCAAYADSDEWCVDGVGDYDCEGGSGNGPNYAPREVELVEPGVDPLGLDRDGDGEGCESERPQAPAEPPPPPDQGTDPQFGTCADAKAAGYGPYYRGQDPEYDWYRDADGDGVVCE